MTFVSIDQIVKNILLKRSYSLHWWIDFAIYCKDCIRELNFDLPINPLKYKILPLNDNHAIDLPTDYVDWSGVYIRRDQYLVPLIEDKSLDLIPNYDSEFNIQPYSQGVATETPNSNQASAYLGGLTAYWFMVNFDMLGENLGRQFGGVGVYGDTFREDRARNEIKINESLSVDHAVLEYIGNGLDIDSASRINAYAQATIEAYCMWQHYLNNRTYSQAEANNMEAKYDKEKERLIARLSDLTLDKMKRIVNKNTTGIKY